MKRILVALLLILSLSIIMSQTGFFSKEYKKTNLTKRGYNQLFEPFGRVFRATYCLANDKGIKVNSSNSDQTFENEGAREIVALVNDAADLVHIKGEAAFKDFRVNGGRWRQGEMYIFVLDPEGNMLVHPDSAYTFDDFRPCANEAVVFDNRRTRLYAMSAIWANCRKASRSSICRWCR